MTATRIAPERLKVMLSLRPELEKRFVLGIENEDGKGSVQLAPVTMSRQFLFVPDRVVFLIN